MAESYDIHLTDPLSAVFKVRAFTTNGTVFPTTSTVFPPTSVGAETSLIVYGKGSPHYGERITENILQIMENFSGASEPQNAVSGQLWYVRNTVIQETGGSFYVWDDITTTWTVITVSGTGTLPIIVINDAFDGQYWLDTAGILYLGVSGGSHPLSPVWLKRVVEKVNITGDPNLTTFVPQNVLKIYTGTEWKDLRDLYIAAFEPTTPKLGDIWYDNAIPQLKIFNGTTFVSVADAYIHADGTTPMTGTLDMGTNTIINLSDPINPQDAATQQYVITEINSAVGGVIIPTALNDLTDVNVPGPTDGQFLKFNLAGPNLWVGSNITLTDITGVTVTPTEVNALTGIVGNIQFTFNTKFDITGGIITGATTIQNNLDVDGNFIHNVLYPSINTDGANKQYVDDVAGGIVGTDTYISSGSLDTFVDKVPYTITESRPSFIISSVTTSTNTLQIAGDLSLVFGMGLDFQVVGSTGNDGAYTILTSSYNGTDTLITTNEPIINATADGSIIVHAFRIAGDVSPRFITAFTFTVQGSSTTDGSYTVSPFNSVYDAINNNTIIPVGNGNIRDNLIAPIATPLGEITYTPLVGRLQLTYNSATPTTLYIDNFAISGHVHPAKDITYTHNVNTMLSDLITVNVTSAAEAIDALDGIVRRRTTNRSNIVIATAGATNIPVVEHDANTFHLFIYVNGLKKIPSIPGQQSIAFTGLPQVINSTLSGLVSTTTYELQVTIDGGTVIVVSVLGSSALTFKDLIATINTQLTTSISVLDTNDISIISDSYGVTSTVLIQDGATNPLLAALDPTFSILPADVGVTYDYAEQVGHNRVGSAITFATAFVGGETIEAIVLGDTNGGLI